MKIRRAATPDDVFAAAHLFDAPPQPDATSRFLAQDHSHLLIAYVGDQPAGFVSGVETTHPDKGTEMFLYELGVDDAFLRRGIGTALVEALKTLAAERGCYAMWTGTAAGDAAAQATYKKTGGSIDDGAFVSWEL
ncbi:GNAT family N-acetyltransferase [Lentzea flava]|uniref:N-acetyltransferase n=1 Tax=Lentzea flava TaxID=103732 RepID=A0ABQ2UYB1_9PSEU|nr:GNAT family N-acetyltransferase [Lentzea flava]MCP2202523.1 Ribosomal protein S18 acetylase RimI [Lentzea flava]GGU59691.1 N-acetyltransferase [Lentzea flava]